MAAQQPAKKISTHTSSAAERKNEETNLPTLTNSQRSSTNGDKGASRVPIKISVTSIGTKDDVPILNKGQNSQQMSRHLTKTLSKLPNAEFDNIQQKKNLARKMSGRDRSTKYWTWLEDIEADSLDGLTDDVKEKLKVAATARHLTEAMEEEIAEQTVEQIHLKRISSEIFDYEKAITLQERAYSEPSVIAPDDDILSKVKIWHPSGPAKILKPILKKNVSQALKNASLEPKQKAKLTFVTRGQSKSSKPIKPPIQKSLTEPTPAPLTPKVSIVNMSFQCPK